MNIEVEIIIPITIYFVDYFTSEILARASIQLQILKYEKN